MGHEGVLALVSCPLTVRGPRGASVQLSESLGGITVAPPASLTVSRALHSKRDMPYESGDKASIQEALLSERSTFT